MDTSSEHERTVAQPRGLVDNATPSANSLGADVLQRLALLTGDETLADRAGSILRAVAPALERQPSAFGRMLCAADRLLGEQIDVVVAGDQRSDDARALRRAAAAPYAPDLVLTGVADTDPHATWPLYVGKAVSGGRATAYACRGYACDEPTTDPARLGSAGAGAGGDPLAREEGQPHRPTRVVGVRIEQRDRLPRAERHASVNDRHRERRRREQRQHVIGAVAGTAVAVAPAVIVRKQTLQGRQQVRIRAGAELDHHDAGRGVRNEDGEQAILRPLRGEERGAGTGQIGQCRLRSGLDRQLAGLHSTHGAA